jgi:preprotein translocase subunit SecF
VARGKSKKRRQLDKSSRKPSPKPAPGAGFPSAAGLPEGRPVEQDLLQAKTQAARAQAPGVDHPEAEGRPMPVRHALGFVRVGRIDFIGRRKWFMIASGIMLLLSIGSMAIQGLNYGIDFTGGNAYNLRFAAPVQESEIRAVLESAGVTGAVIRVDRSDPDEALVRTPYLDSEAEDNMMAALRARFGEVEAPFGDVVSPTIGGELLRDALIAVVLACLGILIYIAVRFEYRFATAGVVGLIHDSLITIGVFSLLRLEINAAFVAAILTVIGYSINNTIVIFDRIRDNLKGRAKEGLDSLANRSVNETFVRSVNTSATAFLAISAIFIFGGASTRDFALALMVGTVIGTYSSICVATPVWLSWRKRDEQALEAPQSRALTAKR